MKIWIHKVENVRKVIHECSKETDPIICYDKIMAELKKYSIFKNLVEELNMDYTREEIETMDDVDDKLLSPLYDYSDDNRIWLGL